MCSILAINKKNSDWINDLSKRDNVKSLLNDKLCNYLIIGAATLFGKQIAIKASGKNSS